MYLLLTEEETEPKDYKEITKEEFIRSLELRRVYISDQFKDLNDIKSLNLINSNKNYSLCNYVLTSAENNILKFYKLEDYLKNDKGIPYNIDCSDGNYRNFYYLENDFYLYKESSEFLNTTYRIFKVWPKLNDNFLYTPELHIRYFQLELSKIFDSNSYIISETKDFYRLFELELNNFPEVEDSYFYEYLLNYSGQGTIVAVDKAYKALIGDINKHPKEMNIINFFQLYSEFLKWKQNG
ncbi:MAG: hypothetical protein ACQESF_02560 [Nanobdellota archaeon]